MKSVSFGAMLLRLQLAVRASPLLTVAGLAWLACLGGVAWTLYADTQLEARQHEVLQAQARNASVPSPVPSGAPVPDMEPSDVPPPDNLNVFYDALGPRRYAEQQVKTLFALAAKNGLTLSQGEYKAGYDRNAHVHTYQVSLPVKGSYGAIWQFALGALRAIPFAALDDIGFRRDSIGDPTVEARLRLTLYLKDAPGAAP